MCANNKIDIKILCSGGEIYSDMDKIWRAIVSNLCMLLKYLLPVHV